MRAAPEYKVRSRHHAKVLQKALPTLMGFACGLSEEMPASHKSTGHIFWRGYRWIVRGTKFSDRYDGVEIKIWGEDRGVRIHYRHFDCDESGMIALLFKVRKSLEGVASGQQTLVEFG